MKKYSVEEAQVQVKELEEQLSAFRESEKTIKFRLLKLCAEYGLSCVLEE